METFDGYRKNHPATEGVSFIYSSQSVRSTGIIAKKIANITLMTCVNTSGSNTFIQFFEKPTIPTAGDKPSYVLPVPAGGCASWAPSQGGRVFAGLSFGTSSTAGTYTAASLSFWMDVEGVSL